MGIGLYHHPLFARHAVPQGHPERPERVRVIEAALKKAALPEASWHEADAAKEKDILRVHDPAHLESLKAADQQARKGGGLVSLDADTWMGPESLAAALHAAGAGIMATRAVLAGTHTRAFCIVRPPGHHAEQARAMGFCLFNNVAIAAAWALEEGGLSRVAIVDFDVHHGNGTQAIFWNEPRVLYCSSHQSPAYPGTGEETERGAHDNIVNCPLPPGSAGEAFRAAYRERILPALAAFAPELLLISAGFDAHAADPLASLRLHEDDYAWVTLELVKISEKAGHGRIVSMLEGGYDLEALAASSAVHVRVLAER